MKEIEQAYEEGYKTGSLRGRFQGHEEGFKEGYTKGFDDAELRFERVISLLEEEVKELQQKYANDRH